MTPAKSPPTAPNRPTLRPTLRDVAGALGVSVATVSNAYNRPDQLSSDLRQRILDTAQTLGYLGPNPLARSLRRGKTGVIGLVYDAPLDYAFADPAASHFLGSLAATIRQEGYNLLLLSCTENAEPVQTASVDGFIVYSSAGQSELLGGVLARQLPTVFVEQEGQSGTIQINIDDESGAAAATRHLSELGHQEIGVLALPINREYHPEPVTPEREAQATYRTSANRLRGYHQGAPNATLHILEVSQNTPQAAQERTLTLLQDWPDVTAIVCMSDVLAQGVMNAARQLNKQIPEDLSLIGFDDLPSSAALNLTTVHQPTGEKGRLAGENLLSQLAGNAGESVTLPTQLVVRGSTAGRRG